MSKKSNKKSKQEEEKKSLKLEILEKVSTLATAGFGLVAALAWNEAIKALFARIFPNPQGNILALLAYAFIITVIVVLVTVQLGRSINLVKKLMGRKKK